MGGSGPILGPRVRAAAVRRNPREEEEGRRGEREIGREKTGNGNTTNFEKGNWLWPLQLLAKRAVAGSGLG